MLKRFSAYRVSDSNEEIYERLLKLFEAGHNKFKYDGEDAIYFKSEDQEDIEIYLGVKFEIGHTEDLKEHIECFDGGEYLQVNSHIQIGINRCIEKVQENFEKYEDRIWEAQDLEKEISKILKEQMYKVFLEYIEDGFDTINNGNFEWN